VNATGVTAGPAESNGKLLLGTWRDSLHVTYGLTACTPGSAPGPTLGNEYGKTLPLPFLPVHRTTQTARLRTFEAALYKFAHYINVDRRRWSVCRSERPRLCSVFSDFGLGFFHARSPRVNVTRCPCLYACIYSQAGIVSKRMEGIELAQRLSLTFRALVLVSMTRRARNCRLSIIIYIML